MSTQDKNLYPKASDVIFAERFLNSTQVGNNGGVISGNPIINNGGTFDGTDDKIAYNQPVYGIKSVSFDLYLETTTEQIMEFNASQSIVATAGTLTATNWTAATIYLNGVAGATVAAATWYRVTITTSTAFNGTAISLGNISTDFGNIRLKNLSFSKSSKTAQEALDDYKNQTFNYENKTVLNLPLRDKIGSSAPFTTTDFSGHGNHATLGDGTTSTTFPTKLTYPGGYSFDGGDYLDCGNIGSIKSVSFIISPSNITQSILDCDGGTHKITVSSGTISATGFSSPSIYVNGILDGVLEISKTNFVTISTAAAFTASAFVFGKEGSNFYAGKVYKILASSNEMTLTQHKNEYLQGSKFLGI